MQALLIQLALFCQADAVLPPPPAPAPIPNVAAQAVVPAAQTTEELRDWLLSRLVVDQGFDPQKSAEVKSLLATMDDRQVRFLVDYYKDRAAKPQQPGGKQATTTADQQAFDQAALNLQQVEAYRDHLKREFDLKVMNGFMNQNLLYQNMINNQRMSYLNYGPYTYVPGFGYSGYGGGYGGYEPVAYGGYGGYGMGMPGYGSAMMYGGPVYGNGVGFY